jgi:Carboxypeptidase regulatory-like domain
MTNKSSRQWLVAACFVALCLGVATRVAAQITTGTVFGTVKDSTGGVVPGATVVLISETKGTKSQPQITNPVGEYVFPYVTGDTYSVEVSLTGFKTVQQKEVKVSGADRVTVPTLTLSPGGTSETITVAAESPLIQASSGERSYAVSTVQIQNLPINHDNFTDVVKLTPGVIPGANLQGAARLGAVGQNNIMMDGASAMDTGNNGQMLAMNIESIGEVKVLASGYQAEYGRSSGLQITAVTKSGSNKFHSSLYTFRNDSDWNTNSWVNQKNGDPKAKSSSNIYGYSVGGPIGKPDKNNKLFFFYAHEYRPTNNPINNGNPIRVRVPTAEERAGDFSNTLDNNGKAFNLIRDYTTNLNCTATDTSGCFQDGGVVGKIPANRIYAPGLALLSRYPMPNMTQAVNTSWNYQVAAPSVKNLTQQPALRLDYQASQKLRVSAKYQGQFARSITTPGSLPGFTDVLTPNTAIPNYAVTVNYALSPKTFLEGTYGFIRNELTGGNEGGVLVNDAANRLTSMPNFPLLYNDAGVLDSRYYDQAQAEKFSPVFWDGKSINLPPTFNWGSRIGSAPPNQRYPGWWNINRTQDVAVSFTQLAGRHTLKAGFYNNHSFKAQNTGAGGVQNLSFQGFVNFSNDANNVLDSGFGFSNAAVGVFSQYLQASKFIEGDMIYNNTEGYMQDNWRVNAKLTLDYGLRITHQGPQYDQFGQMSNFFPDKWSSTSAPVLYVAGCSNGAVTCSGNTRNAMDPRNGQILTAPGAANTQVAIGTPIPGVGDPLNGIIQAGNGIAKTGYTWPSVVIGPRFGFAYDLSGTQSLVVRGGGGIFFDRPDGNTVFSIPGNPPMATARDLRNGSLTTLGQGLSPGPVPALVTFQYDAKVPASVQWNVGVQKTLPWASTIDVSYVGSHGYNRLGGFQGGTTVNQNAVDFGTAYLQKSQDPTLGLSAVAGANAYSSNLLRPYPGLGTIQQNTTEFWDESHTIQTSYQRRFLNGFQAGINYTVMLSFTGNTGLQQRLQHAPDGTISVRADQKDYEALNQTLNLQRNVITANGVWNLPKMSTSGDAAHRVLAYVANDWQLSGIWTGVSGNRWDPTFSYQGGIGNVNLTGSPDYAARIVYVGDAGTGCSSDQYKQLNVTSVTGPQYGSLGLESGRNVLHGCFSNVIDTRLARNIRLSGGKQFSIQFDMFNAFNIVNYTGRQNQVQYTSPTNLTVQNSQTLADGSLDPTRLTPRTAGFGAANAAGAMRTARLYFRFQF